MNPRYKGMLLVAIGALLWGGSGVAAQFVLQQRGFSPEHLVVIRLQLAGLILLAIDTISCPGRIFDVWKKQQDIRQLLLFSFVGMLSVQYTYFAAIKAGNAATATVLQYLLPVIIVVWMTLRYHQWPTKREILCVMMAMLGTLLLVTHGNLTTLSISPAALFWGLMSAFSAAFYTIQPKGLLSRHRSPLVIGWAMLLGGLLLTPAGPPWEFPGILDATAILLTLWIIIFGTVIAFWAYLESIKYISPGETSLLASLEPVSAITLSTVLLDVPFGLSELLGATFIVSAVLLLAQK